ncbi:MAG: hypothetical protein EA397_07960 [Deltaproteobacteria bacterium]|nr:MAG: hypothetical protein EA397_07960 [Deltaproteobacteria bacterium]
MPTWSRPHAIVLAVQLSWGCCGLGGPAGRDFSDELAPESPQRPDRIAPVVEAAAPERPRALPNTPSSPTGPVPARIAPLCGASDAIAFHCSLADEGHLSICAAGGSGSTLQIRAGTPERIQLAIPGSEAARMTRARFEGAEEVTERITVMEPPLLAVLTIVNAEGPTGLMDPVKMELVVHDDGNERLRLSCDHRYGLMSNESLLGQLPGE